MEKFSSIEMCIATAKEQAVQADAELLPVCAGCGKEGYVYLCPDCRRSLI
jgi:hypothetical protein